MQRYGKASSKPQSRRPWWPQFVRQAISNQGLSVSTPAKDQAAGSSEGPSEAVLQATRTWAAPQVPAHLNREYRADGVCRVLSLDGGGAKGFYTLGALDALEQMLVCPLYKRFELIFGTSTGAIIAALLALGCDVETIHETYKSYVPTIMGKDSPEEKSTALKQLAGEVFKDAKFTDVKTGIGIVATKWLTERPDLAPEKRTPRGLLF
ncbi:MAG: patatin-like phospholipase family protein [Nitrosomonadales bacterium]|nr:patatin-like phospholipase family protein [Nitrosomonadales bacterium]